MNARASTIGVGTLVLVATLSAQAPNLAGTWAIDNEKTLAAMEAITPAGAGGGAGPAGSRGTGVPADWVITQTATAVTIVRSGTDRTEQKYVYALNGVESVNTNGRTTLRTKSRVEAGRLVTEGTSVTVSDQGNIEGTLKETRFIDKDGTMHVETERIVIGNPVKVVQIFARKK